MNGPEHYRQAEQLLSKAGNEVWGSPREASCLAEAQVHATLALAAAMAMFPWAKGNDCDAWQRVLS